MSISSIRTHLQRTSSSTRTRFFFNTYPFIECKNINEDHVTLVVVQNVQTWRKYRKYRKYLDSFSTRGRRAWMDQRRTKSSSLEICKLLFRQINKISFFYFREFSWVCRKCLIVFINNLLQEEVGDKYDVFENIPLLFEAADCLLEKMSHY